MSGNVIDFLARSSASPRRDAAAIVLILPVVRVERDHAADFSIPVTAAIAPAIPPRLTLAQKLIEAEQRFPAAKEAGLADGVAGTWLVIERAAAMPQFDVLAYAAGYAEGQLSIVLVPS
jgi:hypothetical protein